MIVGRVDRGVPLQSQDRLLQAAGDIQFVPGLQILIETVGSNDAVFDHLEQ